MNMTEMLKIRIPCFLTGSRYLSMRLLDNQSYRRPAFSFAGMGSFGEIGGLGEIGR